MSNVARRFLDWLVTPGLERRALENQNRHKTATQEGETE